MLLAITKLNGAVISIFFSHVHHSEMKWWLSFDHVDLKDINSYF